MNSSTFLDLRSNFGASFLSPKILLDAKLVLKAYSFNKYPNNGTSCVWTLAMKFIIST
jgi:hypothetical protein